RLVHRPRPAPIVRRKCRLPRSSRESRAQTTCGSLQNFRATRPRCCSTHVILHSWPGKFSARELAWSKKAKQNVAPVLFCLYLARLMENVAVSQQGNVSKRAALLVLAGGLVAGTFDITYACVFWAIKAGARPTRIFQSVARGLLGPASFQGGAKTAALGLFLHYFIAITMSIFYYFAARK